VPRLVKEYEAAVGYRLTEAERASLAPYMAAIPIHYAARAGFFADPLALLQNERPFLKLSAWLLGNPGSLLS
jgi:hypothetical protein